MTTSSGSNNSSGDESLEDKAPLLALQVALLRAAMLEAQYLLDEAINSTSQHDARNTMRMIRDQVLDVPRLVERAGQMNKSVGHRIQIEDPAFKPRDRNESKRARLWARQNGVDVPPVGRLPLSILLAYRAAHDQF